MSALLEGRGLRKSFPAGRADLLGRRARSLRAVDGVDIGLARGEVLGLVGESGCGKSTLARLLMGLVPADSGRVSFMGRDLGELIAEDEGALRSGMQIIFQNPYSSLNPRLTIGQTLTEVVRVASRRGGKAPAGDSMGAAGSRSRPGATGAEAILRAKAALAEVGLPPELLSRYPRELSGGQLQRVGIARALLPGPSLLVADEPLSSLDLSVQAQMLNLLAFLRESRGLALLLVSHDLRVVERVADRVSVMYLGRIVEEGGSGEVFSSPSHPYARALIAAAPDPRRALKAPGRASEAPAARRPPSIRGEPPDPVDLPAGCRFEPRCPERMARCAKEEPGLLELGGGRRAACWLFDRGPAAASKEDRE
jgi:oligopeptide transport system ATP-binding protein